MGIIGITEGAIPFTLKKPMKLVPLNIIGSAVGTATGALFGLTAPYPPIGGLYGFFSIGNPLAYLIGIFTGALIIAIGAIIFVDFNDEEENVEEDIVLEFN